MKTKVLGPLAVALMAGPAMGQASEIDTTGFQNSEIAYFGEGSSATYGQTFTVGADQRLDSFSFFMDDYVDPDFVDFAAYVMAWDGAKATGSVLFSSAGLSTTNNGGADGFEEFTINTGGLVLNSGQQYVAFFSVSDFFDGQEGNSKWASVSGGSVYAGGLFVYQNNDEDFGKLTTDSWIADWECDGCDLSFRMVFSAVPEPGTLALLGLGLAGLGLSRRRKI